jgi:hypothetical protein
VETEDIDAGAGKNTEAGALRHSVVNATALLRSFVIGVLTSV